MFSEENVNSHYPERNEGSVAGVHSKLAANDQASYSLNSAHSGRASHNNNSRRSQNIQDHPE